MPRLSKSQVLVVAKAPKKRSNVGRKPKQIKDGFLKVYSPENKPIYSYTKPMGDMFAHAGRGIGNLLGRYGDLAYNWLSGNGAYNVNSNTVLMGDTKVANFSGDDHSIRVRHREFVGDIFSSTAQFAAVTYNINPANPNLFPWLAPLAISFSEFEIKGMVFEYTSESSVYNGTSQALGYVAGAFNPDSSGVTSLINKQSILNADYSVMGGPDKHILFPIECKPSRSMLSTLNIPPNGVTPSGQPGDLYNFGAFTLATGGNSVGGILLGGLWCVYDIILKKPRIGLSIPQLPACLHYAASACSNTNFFGTARTLQTVNPSSALPPASVTFPSNNSIRVDNVVIGAKMLLTLNWVGTSLATSLPTVVLSGCSLENYFAANTISAQWVPTSGTTNGTMNGGICVMATSNFILITLTSGTGAIPTASVCDIDIRYVDDA